MTNSEEEILIIKTLLFFLRPKYDDIVFKKPAELWDKGKVSLGHTREEQECIDLYKSLDELLREKEK